MSIVAFQTDNGEKIVLKIVVVAAKVWILIEIGDTNGVDLVLVQTLVGMYSSPKSFTESLYSVIYLSKMLAIFLYVFLV